MCVDVLSIWLAFAPELARIDVQQTGDIQTSMLTVPHCSPAKL